MQRSRQARNGKVPPPDRAALDPPKHQLATPLLLLAGVVLWIAYDNAFAYPFAHWAALALFMMLAVLPAVRGPFNRALDRLRHPSARRRGLIAFAVGTIAALYLLALILLEHQAHYPRYHDESMHLIQAQMLARGHLWLPAHALPQFFETFFVFVKPVYAAMQFPGTSLLYVPGIWLGVPYWITSLLIAAVTVGLIYRVMAELIDGIAGLMAALWLVASTDFRYYGLMVLSYPAALVLGLGIVWAWLRWRERKTAWLCTIVGCLSGLAAITRPADALCFAIPVGAAMLLDLRRDRQAEGWGKRAAKMIAVLVASAAPFLVLQLIFDRGVTGSPLHTPHATYVEQFHPRISYGLGGVHSTATPATTLRQKLDYYDSFVVGRSANYVPGRIWRQWISERVPAMFRVAMPRLLALLIVPCGLLGLTTRPRWVLASVLPLMVLVYLPAAIFVDTYVVAAAASVILLALLGAAVIGETWKSRTFVPPLLTAFMIGVGIMGLPNPIHPVREQYEMPTLESVEQQLGTIPGRAVVFFRYAPGQNVHEEPVFNYGTARIDDARIVRAHDLGAAEDLKLIQYYAQRQPERVAYHFDRETNTLTRLGRVTALAAGMPPGN
jgi:hypothetical protein